MSDEQNRHAATPDEGPRYARIIGYLRNEPWAIMPETLAVITDLLRYRAGGQRLTKDEIAARLDGARRDAGPMLLHAADGGKRSGNGGGAVAVIPLVGTIIQRADLFEDVSGLASLDRFRARLREALNTEQVGSIVIDVDSPGGTVSGVAEAAAEVMQGRERKRIVAVANSLMASAAYWVAASATEVVASPSAHVGSIGVFAAHADMSKQLEMLGVDVTLISAGKYKTEGNPFEPLSDEAREAIQASVNLSYDAFVGGVAKGRGTTAAAVKAGYGEGRILTARDAKAEGVVDRVATIEETVDRLLGRGAGGGRRGVRAEMADAIRVPPDALGGGEAVEFEPKPNAGEGDDAEAMERTPPARTTETWRRRLALHRY